MPSASDVVCVYGLVFSNTHLKNVNLNRAPSVGIRQPASFSRHLSAGIRQPASVSRHLSAGIRQPATSAGILSRHSRPALGRHCRNGHFERKGKAKINTGIHSTRFKQQQSDFQDAKKDSKTDMIILIFSVFQKSIMREYFGAPVILTFQRCVL